MPFLLFIQVHPVANVLFVDCGPAFASQHFLYLFRCLSLNVPKDGILSSLKQFSKPVLRWRFLGVLR